MLVGLTLVLVLFRFYFGAWRIASRLFHTDPGHFYSKHL